MSGPHPPVAEHARLSATTAAATRLCSLHTPRKLLTPIIAAIFTCGPTLLAAAPLTPATAPAPAPFALEHTEVHPLPSRELQRRYQLYIGLPAGYQARGTRRYPLLFVTDAPYAFPLLRSLGRRLGQDGSELQDHILVGLSYSEGDSASTSRNRDYTPVPRAEDAGGPARGSYGQAEAYTRYLADEVLPYVQANFRADMDRKVFAGHSYGGLLGAHILLSEPGLFQHYILSSPSLWFERGLLLRRAAARAAQHQPMPAKVLLLTGGYETAAPAALRRRQDAAGRAEAARYSRSADRDLVGDMQRFEALLKAGRLPGLEIASRVLPGEDHLSVNPVSLSQGLRWVLGSGPWAPGSAR